MQQLDDVAGGYGGCAVVFNGRTLIYNPGRKINLCFGERGFGPGINAGTIGTVVKTTKGTGVVFLNVKDGDHFCVCKVNKDGDEEERINVETLPALREILENYEDMMQVVAPDKALTEKWKGNDYTAIGISTGTTIYIIPQKGLAEHRDIAQMVTVPVFDLENDTL